MSRRKKEQPELSYRAFSVREPATFDEAKRSVDFTAATENPVPMWDWDLGVCDEVLLMKGLRMPESGQMPLLDSHSRWSTGDVLGSARDLRVDGKELVATAVFSSVPRADEVLTKIREGHLTDVSIGYRVHDSTKVPEGEKAVIAGSLWEGPVKVVTSWSVHELSVCPIGADQAAKARAAYGPYRTDDEGEETMDKALRKLLEARGLPANATEEQAWAFYADQGRAKPAAPPPAADPPADPDADVTELRQLEAARRAKVRKEELDRQRAIQALCAEWEAKGFDLGDIEADMLQKGTTEVEALRRVNDLVKDQLGARGATPSIQITVEEKDKFREHASAALLLRCGHPAALKDEKARGHDLTGMNLRELAQKALLIAGQRASGSDWARRALTTSDLPNILRDAMMKYLVDGFQEEGPTWQLWCDTGTYTKLKGTIYLPQPSAFSDLLQVEEDDGEYKYGSISDAQETCRPMKFGRLIHVSEATLQDDDLDVISNLPAVMGRAASRAINTYVYKDILFGTAGAGKVMRDTNGLFDTSNHGNYKTSGGSAPDSTSMGLARLAMRKQLDISGTAPLNLRPIYAIVPVKHEGAILKLVNSEYVGTQAYPTQRNEFYQALTPVIEPYMDTLDADRWIAAARKGTTVRVLFHTSTPNGPQIFQREGWYNDGIDLKVRQRFTAAPLDWRGLYCDDGDA